MALEPDGATFAFTVSDNGIGLPAEHRHRLTEPYVTTRAKGTGLGLAIVARSWKTMAARSRWAMREGGEGAEVTLTLPFLQKTCVGKVMRMSKNGSLIASEILVVDDEEDIRDLISGILRDEGYETRQAGDSESALAASRGRRPQLVILDIWLQGSQARRHSGS